MENKSDTPKHFTYLPFQLSRILDSHCYKILSILVNLRNFRGKEEIDVPQSKLAEFSGLSESTIKTTLKALKSNSLIDVVPSTSIFNDDTKTYENTPNRYTISDLMLEDWEKKTWSEVKEIKQIKISDYSNHKEIEHRERKPLKGEIIFPLVDVNLTAEENTKMLNEMNIDVKRATVSNVLKLKRESQSGNKIVLQENDLTSNTDLQEEVVIEPDLEALENEFIYRYEHNLPMSKEWINMVKTRMRI